MAKKQKMTLSNWLKLGMATLETIMGIPVLGGLFILTFVWIPMIIALTGHIVTLVFSCIEGKSKNASIIGIVANTVGVIPVVGMILHIIAAIFNWIGAFKD